MPAIQASGDVSVGNLPQIRPGKPGIQKARIGLEKTVNLHRFRQPVTDTLIPGKEPGPCNHARQFQQVPGRTEEHGAMLGDEVEVLTGETNERSPLSELLHDELPGKQGVSIAFSPVDDEVEWMIIHEEFPPVDPGVVSEIERQATVCEMGLGEIPFAGAKVVSKAGEVDVNLHSAVRQA